MHSRIFEVVKVADGNEYAPKISVGEIYDWTEFNSFYDYIRELSTEETQDSIKWLKDYCPDLFNGNNELKLTKKNKKKYFKPKYDKLFDIVNDLTLEDFSLGILDGDMKMYYIKEALGLDCGGFYIVVQEDDSIYDVCNLDSFVREYSGAYRIINAFDYHF